jgi:3-hydroxybutyryl-CoA dehydrogenase
MDLVGIDVGFEVSKSFYEQSFHEPRWRPSPIQAQMVQAGRFGRKAGRGYYTYPPDGGHRPEDPEPPPGGGGAGAIVVEGDGELAGDIRRLAADAGYAAMGIEDLEDGQPDLVVDAQVARAPGEWSYALEQGATPLLLLCVDGSLASLDSGGGAIGFHAISPLADTQVVELTRSRDATDTAAARAESFFRSLARHVEWVGDAPGLVLGRIVCQLANEAAFALAEGVGSREDVDAALRLGFNHPRGPLERADAMGLDQVLATLDALRDELGEERYRAAPLLRRMVANGRLGRSTGEGFFTY